MKDTINPFIVLIEKIKETSNIVIVCCVCKRAMKYNKKWIPISSLQMQLLYGIIKENISHTYCPTCYKKELKAIHNINKQVESEKKDE